MATSIPAGSRHADTDLYALLHVSHDASEEEIKRAYRQLATVYHPDKYQHEQVRGKMKRETATLRGAHASRAVIMTCSHACRCCESCQEFRSPNSST